MRAVSVVIAVRNGQAHLPSVAALLAAQDLRDLEVVVVDDASTDATPAILREWAAYGLFGVPVRVVTSPSHRGAGASRMLGLRAATGTRVWFADVDDRWEPTLLSRMVTLADEHGADVVAGRARPETVSGDRHGMVLYGRPSRPAPALLTGSAAAGALLSGEVMGYLWDKLFERERLLSVYDEGIDLRTHEDLLVMLRLFATGPRVLVVPDELYRYVIWPASLSREPVPSYPDLLRCGAAADELVAQVGPVTEHGPFMTRYIGLLGLEDAARKGRPDDVRRAATDLADALRRSSPQQVAAAHGTSLAARVAAAQLAPLTYARVYRSGRNAIRRFRRS